jgi:hypothetical protein
MTYNFQELAQVSLLAVGSIIGVRGAAALAKLPEAERRQRQQLWKGIEALERRAAAST